MMNHTLYSSGVLKREISNPRGHVCTLLVSFFMLYLVHVSLLCHHHSIFLNDEGSTAVFASRCHVWMISADKTGFVTDFLPFFIQVATSYTSAPAMTDWVFNSGVMMK